MNHKQNPAQARQSLGPPLQHRLLVELDDIIKEIEDGTVKDSTFIGCIALGRRDLSPLSENQSKQIKEVLLRAPVTPDQPIKGGAPILSSVFNFIRSLWGGHDTKVHPVQDGIKSNSSLLDQNSRVKSQEIQETDVKQFFVSQGEDSNWVLPYAWDIANRLSAVKQSEADGDLTLFLERRRKLNVRRPKSTLFEQSAQRFAVKISELYCDEKGAITNEKSLEIFIGNLVATLLEKTKTYWTTSSLLSIFDGLVATVLRPLLHKHQTSYFPSETTTATGVIVSGNTMGKMERLVTTPKWNEASQQLVTNYVKKSFKAHVWSFFLDRSAPYNRDYAKSPHLNAAALTNAGLLVKSFGNPIHLSNIMQLLQPTNQEDELVQYVVDHFRSDAIIDH